MSLSLLLDTHALLWWAHQPSYLSQRAFDALADGANALFVSPVSAMEIATKNRLGKLEFTSELAQDFVDQIAGRGFKELPISAAHAQLAGNYRVAHKDPWDRLLAAQSELDELTLVTSDGALQAFGVRTLW